MSNSMQAIRQVYDLVKSSRDNNKPLSDDGKFVLDYEFYSTSAVASVIMGQANSLTSWKDENGIKLETLLGRRRG